MECRIHPNMYTYITKLYSGLCKHVHLSKNYDNSNNGSNKNSSAQKSNNQQSKYHQRNYHLRKNPANARFLPSPRPYQLSRQTSPHDSLSPLPETRKSRPTPAPIYPVCIIAKKAIITLHPALAYVHTPARQRADHSTAFMRKVSGRTRLCLHQRAVEDRNSGFRRPRLLDLRDRAQRII